MSLQCVPSLLPACCLLVLSSSERSGSLRTCRLGSRRVSYGHVALCGGTVAASTALDPPNTSLTSLVPQPSLLTKMVPLQASACSQPQSSPEQEEIEGGKRRRGEKEGREGGEGRREGGEEGREGGKRRRGGKEGILTRQEYKSGAILPSSPFPTGRSLPTLVGHAPGSTDAGWCPAQTTITEK